MIKSNCRMHRVRGKAAERVRRRRNSIPRYWILGAGQITLRLSLQNAESDAAVRRLHRRLRGNGELLKEETDKNSYFKG